MATMAAEKPTINTTFDGVSQISNFLASQPIYKIQLRCPTGTFSGSILVQENYNQKPAISPSDWITTKVIKETDFLEMETGTQTTFSFYDFAKSNDIRLASSSDFLGTVETALF